jgi:hypothetical protein
MAGRRVELRPARREPARRPAPDATGTVRAPPLGTSADVPSPRPGWYAYQVTGPAELPPWAVEVALTIERPLQPESQDPRGGSPWPGPAAPDLADPEATDREAGMQAVLLLRARGKMCWLDGIAQAVAEVETLAAARPEVGQRLLVGPELPGLAPVTDAEARGLLGVAGTRGLPAPLRRWRPTAHGVEPAWRPSAGAVLTCEGPSGVSAQAVVALSGLGNVSAVTPPPGGALVLRAWRAGRAWGLACGLVLGASTALGLGREAGRVAAKARADGWGAQVLSGAVAPHMARAGSPELPAPEAAARAATEPQVAALLEACLAAGGLDNPHAGPRWALAVTP